MNETPRVSVVIPILNEEKDIHRLLCEILTQQEPPGGFEVLVADGGSTDRTREIVTELSRSWPNLTLLDNPKKLSSAGRNVGAWAARGEFVLFLDGHCSVPRSDYLVRLVEIFEATGAACLCRPQPLIHMAVGFWDRAIAVARHSSLGHNPGSDIYGGSAAPTDPRSAGAAYRRAALELLHGYDDRFDACEDVEFNHRVAEAGLFSYRHPDLSIHYRPKEDPKLLFKQMMRYGRGRARLFARHPKAVSWALVTIVAVDAIRLRARGGNTLRTAVALGAIHSGLILGFWRGLLEFPRFRKPMRTVR
jgi:succinoglycan biosynthesis protein ExoA